MTAKVSRAEQSAAATIGGCEDLLNLILLYLPVKSLTRFRLVSNQWLSVISNPVFGRNHVSVHHNNSESLTPSGLYVYNSPSKTPELYSLPISSSLKSLPCLSFLEKEAHGYGGGLGTFEVIQSCNGLLLCRLGDGFRYCVCNPTTKALRMLPHEPNLLSCSSGGPWLPALAFNPLNSQGFKVFSIRFSKPLEAKPRRKIEKCVWEVLVYSSELGVWKGTGYQFEFPIPLRICQALFHVGRYITWISEGGIIEFDLLAEKVTVEIHSTSGYLASKLKNVRYFGEWNNGSLKEVEMDRIHNLLSISTLKMFPDGVHWLSTRPVHFYHLLSAGYPEILTWKRTCTGLSVPQYMVQVLAVSNEGKELYLRIPGKVIRYCVKSREATLLGMLPDDKIDPQDLCVASFEFVETLIPL